ncbi:hypothetical protein BDN72DRAFT_789008 [Pluteus cervinus]|uniref:Uncharacterized protein n=1 Tax=Pluteus cervinus TaxID=181527 RepID=A0ACD3BAT6_9AGAR|nr:hypothetical protein BDN72DRAFT_789008 [Pluteus cervinus]
MPLNVPGILVPFHLLINSRIVLPGLCVRDIRHLDFEALRRAGYRGAIFDKDNCLTIPYKDELVPELKDAWNKCRETFGEGNVLIVSNSAGTKLDPGGIQAESVRHHLLAPVLFHSSMKPSYSCIHGIRAYFSSLRSPIRDEELIVVGDRIFTDIVMANRMRKRVSKLASSPSDSVPPVAEEKSQRSEVGPLAIWTTGVWKKEAMALRWMESKLVDAVRKWTQVSEPPENIRFIQEVPEPPQSEGFLARTLSRFRS